MARPRSRIMAQGRPKAAATRSIPGRINSARSRSEEHTSELQSLTNLVCRLLLEKKKKEEIDLGDLDHDVGQVVGKDIKDLAGRERRRRHADRPSRSHRPARRLERDAACGRLSGL